MRTGLKRYKPSDPVVVVRLAAVPSLVSVTFAPLTTAPEGSVTVPVMEPVSTWACRGRMPRTAEIAKANKVRRIQEDADRFMSSPLSLSQASHSASLATHSITKDDPPGQVRPRRHNLFGRTNPSFG